MNRGRIELAAELWPRTLALFATFAAAGVEGGCFWYGTRAPDPEQSSQVGTIGIPRQINRPRNFSIPADALAEMNGAVGRDEEVLVQLHGHPGPDVRMSEWDKQMAVSRQIVSVILPFWGAAERLATVSIGVHIFDAGAWRRVDVREVTDLLVERAGPSTRVVDCR